jgi:hypothetical protein
MRTFTIVLTMLGLAACSSSGSGSPDTGTADGAGDHDSSGPPMVGSPCNAGDTCGGPPLGCAYGVSLMGLCQHCGGANEVCCNSTGIASGTCDTGITCNPAVDTARRCSSP